MTKADKMTDLPTTLYFYLKFYKARMSDYHKANRRKPTIDTVIMLPEEKWKW